MKHYLYCYTILFAAFLLLTNLVQAEQLDVLGSDSILYLDQSIERESSVEGNVDGRVIDDSDVLLASQVWFKKGGLLRDATGDGDLQFTYSLLNIAYDEYSNNDFFFHTPALEWRQLLANEHQVKIKGGIEFTALDGDDLYQALNLGLKYQNTVKQLPFDSLGYQYSNLDYESRFGNGRDGSEHELELMRNLPPLWNSETATVELELAAREADTEGYGFNGFMVEGEWSWLELPYGTEFLFNGSYRLRDYKDTYPGFTKGRKDNRLSLSAELSKLIYKDLITVTGEWLFENNESNLDPFEFDSTTLGLHISFLWA